MLKLKPSTLATYCEELTHWSYAGKDGKQKEKGVAENEMVKLWEIVEDKEPSVLQSIRSQRVRHDLVSEQ